MSDPSKTAPLHSLRGRNRATAWFADSHQDRKEEVYAEASAANATMPLRDEMFIPQAEVVAMAVFVMAQVDLPPEQSKGILAPARLSIQSLEMVLDESIEEVVPALIERDGLRPYYITPAYGLIGVADKDGRCFFVRTDAVTHIKVTTA